MAFVRNAGQQTATIAWYFHYKIVSHAHLDTTYSRHHVRNANKIVEAVNHQRAVRVATRDIH